MSNLIKKLLSNIIYLVQKTFTISICALFIVGGAVNNGMTGSLMAVPFFIVFFLKLKSYDTRKRVFWLLLLILICAPLEWNKPKNTILYPYLNTEAEIKSGWGYEKHSDYYTLISPEAIEFKIKSKKIPPFIHSRNIVVFDKDIRVKMDRMHVSHSEFSTHLLPVYLADDGTEYLIFTDDLFKGVSTGTIKSSALVGVDNLQSSWTISLGNLMSWPMAPAFIPLIFY